MFSKEGIPYFRCGETDKTLEECGFSKTIETKAIIKREIVSERSFTKKVGYFLVDLTYKIPIDEKKYRYSWFYYHPEQGMKTICIRNFTPFMVDNFGNYQQLTYGINPYNRTFLKVRSKPKRITENEARALIQNHEILGIFSETVEGLAQEVS